MTGALVITGIPRSMGNSTFVAGRGAAIAAGTLLAVTFGGSDATSSRFATLRMAKPTIAPAANAKNTLRDLTSKIFPKAVDGRFPG